MNIAVVSKADSHGGGASRVAEDLSHLLNASGVPSTHYVAWSHKPVGGTLQSLYGKNRKLIASLHKATRRVGLFEYVPFEMMSVLSNHILEPHDLFHFHDLTTAISPATLDYVSRRKPLVWTFHDCSPFTGGCIHPAPGCERYKDECGSCPNLGVWPLNGKRDRTRLLVRQKQRLLRSGRVRVVTPSAWLAEKAWDSGSLVERPFVIPNPVDTRIFHPYDRRRAREKLGIPQDRPIVLFTAGDLSDELKGTRVVAELARALPNIFLLLVGKYSLMAAEIYDGLDKKFTGYVTSADDLACMYSAADLFVNFTITDNMPLVVLETMACGVPCVSYRTGGIPEMIVQGETGVVVEQNDVQGAIAAVRELLAGTSPAMGRAARARAEREYGTETFLARHVALYERILDADARAAE